MAEAKFLAWPLMLLGVGCGLAYEQRTESYDARHGEFGTLDVYVPKGAPGLRPGVVVVHPGGWTSGSKSDLAEQAARLARSGFVVANVNYRLAPEARYPAPIEDAWCALAYFRAHAADLELDPSRVAVLGYSAGAYLADMVGLNPRDPTQAADCPSGTTGAPAAIVAGDAPADLAALPSSGDAQLADFLGRSKADAPDLYAAASPLSHVAAGAPPFLLIHGTEDWYVDWHQSARMQDALAAARDDVSLLLLAGSGHTLNPGADLGGADHLEFTIDSPEGWSAILEFLHRTIGRPPP